MNFIKTQITSLINENPRSILEFYNKVQPYLEKYFKNKIDNKRDREEVIQDTIISILDSLPGYKFQSKFTTWIYSIARHELIDYYRRKKIKHILFSTFPFLENIIDKALGPQFALEEKEAKHKIYNTFKNLTEGYSQILRLRYLEGLTVSQISEKLNITYKAAESKLSRARLAFQKEYSG